MSEKSNGNAKNPAIEEVIRNTLTGDAQKNALDYAAFLEASGIALLSFEGVWNYADGSVLYVDGGANIPGPWTIWADCPPTAVDGFPRDEDLKAFAWSHANTCGKCGCGLQPGLRKTLFGREFDNICSATLMFTDPDAATLSSIKKLALMNKRVKERRTHPAQKTIQTIVYQGCTIEVVERPDVLWVGCVDYACGNQGESDIGATLKRYREELIDVPKRELINPDWSAALSINYKRGDKPCGIMFAQETYTDQQDERYDLFTQPGGLWMRILSDSTAASRLLGKDKAEPYEFFAQAGILQKIADENGYIQNPDVHVEVEYHCHAEYATPPHTSYAYIPVKKKA